MGDERREARLRALREEFMLVRGYWTPLWDSVLDLDPDYFEAYLRLSEIPWRRGRLDPKVKELLYIAVDVVTTHLYEPGIRIHMRNALALGATESELMEVLELSSLIGLEAGAFGAGILSEEMQSLGITSDEDTSQDDHRALAAAFEARYGGWSPGTEALASMDPGYVAAMLGLIDAASSLGALDPLTVHLVLLAANASVTHADPERARVHIRRALQAGAEPAAVIEVLQLASVVGVHTLVISVPILVEEVARHGG